MNSALALRVERNRPWRALAVLLTGNFVTILDLFIVNVALPSIQSGLSASDTDLQLIVVAYALAYGLCLINGARLGDLFGRRRLFLAGMGAVFFFYSAISSFFFALTLLLQFGLGFAPLGAGAGFTPSARRWPGPGCRPGLSA